MGRWASLPPGVRATKALGIKGRQGPRGEAKKGGSQRGGIGISEGLQDQPVDLASQMIIGSVFQVQHSAGEVCGVPHALVPIYLHA